MNIQFSYLYRDAGNFKRFGSVTLANPEGLAPSILEKKIREVLIDGLYFVAEGVFLPSLRFPDYLPELDHNWHEFECISESTNGGTDPLGRTASRLVEHFGNAFAKTSGVKTSGAEFHIQVHRRKVG